MTDTKKNASFQRRLGAMVYDAFLLFALLFIASTPVVIIAGGADSPWIKGAGFKLYLYLVCFLFYGWFWTHGGQTLGMRSWKIRVLRDDNRPLGWDSALIRFLMATISLSLLGIGFLWILFSRENMAWHDQISRTHVLFDPEYGKKSA